MSSRPPRKISSGNHPAVSKAADAVRKKMDSIDESTLPLANEALGTLDRVIATLPPSSPPEAIDATDTEKETPPHVIIVTPVALPSEAETLPAPPEEEEGENRSER